jgi:hypothetical protein
MESANWMVCAWLMASGRGSWLPEA